jgi:dTDP-4-amino-4,6-dideoxygalactose transaminase
VLFRSNAIAKKHNLAVVEDACQAWLADYKGRKCGTLGDLGCFSFQNSKHIPAGEGGAITGKSDDLLDRCHAFHNCGRAHGTFQGNGYFSRGTNFRMTHYQAAMLRQQLDKLVAETDRRQENADHPTGGDSAIGRWQQGRIAFHLPQIAAQPGDSHSLQSQERSSAQMQAFHEALPCQHATLRNAWTCGMAIRN